MLIQVASDNTVESSEGLISTVEADVQSALGRFEERLTRVEAHLSEEKGEAKCLLEARPANHQPVVVTGTGDSLPRACKDATRKMQDLLTSTFGRLDAKSADETIRTAEPT